ncbi:hypothetical protein HZB02_01605 [Candidatus Woesearchaeota archaeon]|nr:hypothetical protein [Candidatus Woesearchaeota archaeon]
MKQRVYLIFTVMVLIVIHTTFASPSANRFEGNVTIDGNSSSAYVDNNTVIAYVNGVRQNPVAGGEVTVGHIEGQDIPSYYLLTIGCSNSDTVGFQINGIWVFQANRTCSQGAQTLLNLSMNKSKINGICTSGYTWSNGGCASGLTCVANNTCYNASAQNRPLTGFSVGAVYSSKQNYDTAREVLSKLNPAYGCEIIIGWKNGFWQPYKIGAPVNNFSLETGKGYFLYCRNAPLSMYVDPNDYLPLSGSSFRYRMNPGNNFITPVCNSTSLHNATAFLGDLNAQGGACIGVARWNGSVWQFYQSGVPLNNFGMVRGEGYLVTCRNTSYYNLSCIV